MIISSCFLSESDSDSDYRAEFTNKTACNRGKGNQMTGGKLYDDAECVEKTQKFPMTFVIYKNSSKKIKTLF